LFYVYYDEKYPSSWISERATNQIVNYLSKHDFQPVDASTLKNIMTKGVREKISKDEIIVVFSQDVVPDTIVDNPSSPTANSLIRGFLNSGHTIVWIGDIPLYYVGSPGKRRITIGDAAKQNVLGLNQSVKHLSQPRLVRPTILGAQLGMPSWKGLRPMHLTPPSPPPHVQALAGNPTDTTHYHAIYARYTSIPELSGFIRVYDMPIRELTEELLIGVLCLATRTAIVSFAIRKISNLESSVDTKFKTLKSEIETLISPKLDEIIDKLESPTVKTLEVKTENLERELNELANKINEKGSRRTSEAPETSEGKSPNKGDRR